MSNQCILAMDIGGTFLKCALVKKDNIIVEGSFAQVQVNSTGTLYEAKSSYQYAIKKMYNYANSKNLKIIGAGIDTPGPFDYKLGASMMVHKYPEMNGIPLRPWYTEILGDVPINFLSDSAAYLLGQLDRDQVKEYSRICLVTLGTGLGFGAYVDGQILSTDVGGPAVVIFNSPYKDEIAEYYTTRLGIIRRYRHKELLAPEDIDVKDIAKLAMSGNKNAIDIFYEEGEMLAEILKPIIDENRFEVLIVGGQIAKAYSLFSTPLEDGLLRCNNLKLVTSATNYDISALLGAAKSIDIF